MKEIVVIGGGLAGLVNAILLNRAGFQVKLFEEKTYPFHKVCGEYISNEVVPFLKLNGLYPSELKPVPISKFRLTSPSGNELNMPLDLGGFGISRYSLDKWLLDKGIDEGIEHHTDRVTSCSFRQDHFDIETRQGEFTADLVIGSFGKRSVLDKSLSRSFIEQRSPYVGVKYHILTEDVAHDVVELHNFKNGYCGVSRVENGVFNLCYLTHRSNLKTFGTIPSMEDHVLQRNPFLRQIFSNATFHFDKPEVINEITFEPKEPVFNHILMSGDSAGMITPLCGNGMAMAIHSAKLLSELIIENVNAGFDRSALEENYTSAWRRNFSRRLWAGRKIQYLFGAPLLSEVAVGLGKSIPLFAGSLMKKTHGHPF